MRTTLDIDDDVLLAAKSMAEHEGISIGRALSTIARLGLLKRSGNKQRNGVPLLPRKASDPSVVSLELVNRLRDEDM